PPAPGASLPRPCMADRDEGLSGGRRRYDHTYGWHHVGHLALLAVRRDLTLRRLAGLLAPYRWRLAGSVAALLIASALQLAVVPLASSLTNAIAQAAGTGHV